MNSNNCFLLTLILTLNVQLNASLLEDTTHFDSEMHQERLMKAQPDGNLTASDVEALIRASFGDLFVLASNKQPCFVVGDFNGDGNKDIAICARLSRQIDRSDNSIPNFRLYVPSPPEFDASIWGKPNPLGTLAYWRRGEFLLVLHGAESGWDQLSEKDKSVLLVRSVGSSVTLFSFRGLLKPETAYHGQKQIGPPPSLEHDSILLRQALSDDKDEIIYWDGANYRYYPVRHKSQ